MYDWTIVDRIIDTYLERRMKPLVEIGFMPEALSTHPKPYRHFWKPGGNTRPLHRLGLSADRLRQVGRAGVRVGPPLRREVRPGGSRELVVGGLERARHRLLARDARGVPEALRLRRRRPEARAADGAHRRAARHRAQRPADAGVPARVSRALPARHQLRDRQDRLAARLRRLPREGRAARDVRRVRAHERRQPAPRDRQRLRRSSRRSPSSRERRSSSASPIPKAAPRVPSRRTRRTPIATARCTRATPPNSSRGPTSWPTGITLNLLGAVTWAFEFEDQPYFAGFRDLATNGIDKPVLNVFRMLGLMSGDRVAVESTGSLPLDEVRDKSVTAPARRRRACDSGRAIGVGARLELSRRRREGYAGGRGAQRRGHHVSYGDTHPLSRRSGPQQRLHGVASHGIARDSRSTRSAQRSSAPDSCRRWTRRHRSR